MTDKQLPPDWALAQAFWEFAPDAEKYVSESLVDLIQRYARELSAQQPEAARGEFGTCPRRGCNLVAGWPCSDDGCPNHRQEKHEQPARDGTCSRRCAETGQCDNNCAPQPADGEHARELALAVEHALGWREKERDDELNHLLAMAMSYLEKPALDGDTHQFKNFHRSLCARFGYTHDEIDWRRDLVSLEEHIAKQVTQPADGEAVAYTTEDGGVIFLSKDGFSLRPKPGTDLYLRPSRGVEVTEEMANLLLDELDGLATHPRAEAQIKLAMTAIQAALSGVRG